MSSSISVFVSLASVALISTFIGLLMFTQKMPFEEVQISRRVYMVATLLALIVGFFFWHNGPGRGLLVSLQGPASSSGRRVMEELVCSTFSLAVTVFMLIPPVWLAELLGRGGMVRRLESEGDTASIARLVEGHEPAYVRSAAIRALSRRQPDGIAWLASYAAKHRNEAARIIQLTHHAAGESAVSALIQQLPVDVCGQVLRQKRVGPVQVSLIRSLTHAGKYGVRALMAHIAARPQDADVVIDALRQSFGPTATGALVPLLAESESEVRRATSQVLERLSWKPQDRKEELLWTLVREGFDKAVAMGVRALIYVRAEPFDANLAEKRAVPRVIPAATLTALYGVFPGDWRATNERDADVLIEVATFSIPIFGLYYDNGSEGHKVGYRVTITHRPSSRCIASRSLDGDAPPERATVLVRPGELPRPGAVGGRLPSDSQLCDLVAAEREKILISMIAW